MKCSLAAGILLFLTSLCVAQEQDFKLVGELRIHTKSVNSLVSLGKNGLIASGSDDSKILIWDQNTRRLVSQLLGHTDPVTDLTVCSDGSILASSSTDESVRLWNTATGQQIKILNNLKADVLSVAFSPDGRILASGLEEKRASRAVLGAEENLPSIILWDVNSGQQLASIKADQGDITCLSYHPLGKVFVTTGSSQSIKVWDGQNFSLMNTLSSSDKQVKCAIFSPDGKLLVDGTTSGSVEFWDWAAGTQTKKLQMEANEAIDCIAFSPDGQFLVLGTRNGSAVVYDLSDPSSRARIIPISKGRVTSLSFSDDSRFLITGSEDGTIKSWQVPSVISKDPSVATARFMDDLHRRLGNDLDYDEITAAFTCIIKAKQLDQARSLYRESLSWKSGSTNQDSLDKKFLGLAYGLSSNCPDLLTNIRIAFIRAVKSLYGLNDEEAKPIYALHELVLSQGLVSGASEITNSLLRGTILPENRYVRLADAFLKYKRTDDAVGTFNVMIKKRSLDKTGYGDDLSKLYAGMLQQQKTAEAQDLMGQINALDENDVNKTYAKLADIFTKEGQADKSINILQKLIQNDPTNVALSIKLGDAFFAKGRYDDIIASFANNKTKEGMRYLARAYEKEYKLVEANKVWDALKQMTTDPQELSEIKKHFDDNLITIMSPDYTRLQAEANRPKAVPGSEKLRVVIDSPSDGFQTASNSVEVTGRVLGAVTLQDVRINGNSVGTPRGMKPVETTAQNAPQDTTKGGLPFMYVVALAQGKNDIRLQAFAPTGDSAEAKVSVTMNAAAPKPMTIEEADGIRQNKAYAVIVGVAHYESSEITPLNYTVNDAQALYQVLTDPNYGGFKKDHVTLLTDKEATMANIKKAIGVDLQRAPQDGIAVVFFAGHGAPEGGKTYWLTYDTDPTSLYASTLSNTDIADMLSRINTKRVVTFIDACYSGASVTTSKSTRAFIEDPFKAFEGQGTMYITSSNGNEESLEDAKLKHGLFTYRLIQALQGAADYNGDGIVMADEVAKYIRENVPNDARERSQKQDPQVISNYSGFIPISRNPEKVMENSRIMQVQEFQNLYRDGKIDGATYVRIKNIIEGSDEASKKPIKDYFNKVLTLKDLIDLMK